jgi:hypothetical protein
MGGEVAARPSTSLTVRWAHLPAPHYLCWRRGTVFIDVSTWAALSYQQRIAVLDLFRNQAYQPGPYYLWGRGPMAAIARAAQSLGEIPDGVWHRLARHHGGPAQALEVIDAAPLDARDRASTA